MVDPDLRALADDLLAQLQRVHPLRRPARIEWRSYRVSAGMAYYRQNLIGLSRHVITDAERTIDTLTHEFAHLLAHERHGRAGRGHGPAWQSVMVELGRPPRVRHSYDVQRNTKRQEVGYECLRCGKTLTRARRLPKRRKYVHANCGGDLRLSFIRSSAAVAITDVPRAS